MNDQELVKKCLVRICQNLGFDPGAMIQRDYELVSTRIEEQTGILISVSTIKRLLNGEFSRLPQAATLNAISGYLGYKDWYEYRSTETREQPVHTDTKPAGSNLVSALKNLTRSRKWRLITAFGIMAGVILLAGFLKGASKPISGIEKASFSVKKTTRNDIPNTVVFSYNIDDVKADSFFIQQSWDENRRVRIYKRTYTLTDIYYEPGYHKAKLIANDQVIRSFDVSIPTGDWFFYAVDKGPKRDVEYIRGIDAVKNGALSLTPEDVVNNRIDTQKERNYVYCLFPEKMEVSSDNYIFKARVRVKEVRNNFCPYLMCEVFTQKYFMFFRSGSAGCASESMIGFGENFLTGKNNDLSSLGLDVTQWTDVEMLVKDKQVTVSYNGKKVYSLAYNNSSGFVTGLGFISSGLCEVDFVELKGLDGRVVYASDFNQ